MLFSRQDKKLDELEKRLKTLEREQSRIRKTKEYEDAGWIIGLPPLFTPVEVAYFNNDGNIEEELLRSYIPKEPHLEYGRSPYYFPYMIKPLKPFAYKLLYCKPKKKKGNKNGAR